MLNMSRMKVVFTSIGQFRIFARWGFETSFFFFFLFFLFVFYPRLLLYLRFAVYLAVWEFWDFHGRRPKTSDLISSLWSLQKSFLNLVMFSWETFLTDFCRFTCFVLVFTPDLYFFLFCLLSCKFQCQIYTDFFLDVVFL